MWIMPLFAGLLKSLAARLMRHVGASAGAPVAFDACAAAMKLGGVPAPDAPGAHGTGALAGAARRLHDVASILIRVGVLDKRALPNLQAAGGAQAHELAPKGGRDRAS